MDCSSGEKYFSCAHTKFQGCCTVDACFKANDCVNYFGFLTQISEEPSTSANFREITLPSKTATEEETATEETTAAEETDGMMWTGGSPKKTDSGTTRTIPNNSIVTVTRKTLIVTDKRPTWAPTSTDSLGSEPTLSTLLTATGGDSPTETNPSETGLPNERPISKGAIAGAAVGSAVLIGALIILTLAILRRRKGLSRSRSNATSTIGAAPDAGEKLPQSMSAHTTGTQESADPFAPFGGRIDKPSNLHAPPQNTFEMDATSTVPVELPAESIDSRPTPRTEPQSPRDSGPSDPRANLNASLKDRRQNTYVNHWNQWRSMGQEENQ